MKRHDLRSASAVASFVVAVTSASAAGSAGQDHVLKGPAVPLGAGTAQAWISMDETGRSEALGVSLSEAAVQGIAALHQTSLTLPFPAEAAGTGFDHVFLNWNPHGHPPAEIWGTPHVDVHFYMISQAVREAITPDDPAFRTKARRQPEARFLPANYLLDAEPVPTMGVHWVDEATPEFHGQPFTHTLIYGAWDGQVIFIEPMVTKAIFDSRETLVAPVKQPQAVAFPGNYPTQYRIDFDPEVAEHRVVLEGLVARK